MRNAKQIVDQTNELARAFYEMRGYEVTDDHKFYETERVNYHPDEHYCWRAACEAQLLLTDTDVFDSLQELELD